jgi:hypothetical protein
MIVLEKFIKKTIVLTSRLNMNSDSQFNPQFSQFLSKKKKKTIFFRLEKKCLA